MLQRTSINGEMTEKKINTQHILVLNLYFPKTILQLNNFKNKSKHKIQRINFSKDEQVHV